MSRGSAPEHAPIVHPEDELRISAERFASLPMYERNRIAKKYGHSIETFTKLLGNVGKAAADIARRAKEIRTELDQYRLVPTSSRVQVANLKLLKSDLPKAERLEQKGYDLHDKRGQAAASHKAFLQAFKIQYWYTFGEYCRDSEMHGAYQRLANEIHPKLARTNIPELREAAQQVLKDIAAFADFVYERERRRHTTPDTAGPTERFDNSVGRGWPGNGRSPRRLNDEHERW